MVCYCCVKGCHNNSNSVKKYAEPITFHAFPTNAELKQKWLYAIGRPTWRPPKYARICSAHFSSDKMNFDGYRTRIKEDACPVNNLPPNSNFEASDIEVCRICLATDVKMFSLETGELKHYMETIFANDSNYNIECLPNFVCYECAGLLTKSYKLMEKSMIAQATLLDIFAENTQITKSLVRKRNRKQLNLQSTLSNNLSTPCHIYEYIYNEEENISHLKNKYVIGDNSLELKHQQSDSFNSLGNDSKSELILTKVKTEINTVKYEQLEINFCQEDPADNTSDNETNENKMINQPISYDTLKYEQLETNLKIENEDYLGQVGENDQAGNTENETNENAMINPSVIIVHKFEAKDNKMESKIKSRVVKEKKKLLTKQARKVKKKPKSLDDVTPHEIEMGKYFDIVKLSEQQQIEEWNKAVVQPSFSSENIFKCDVCLKIFASKSAYDKHVTCHDIKCGLLECPVCKRRFKSKVLLRAHITRMHGKKYHCKSCPKVFNNLSVAKKHHRLHTGHIYSCAHCAFTSAHASALAKHTRTQHAHANAHSCARCGHSFVSARALTLHVGTAHRADENVTPSAEFRCEQCGVNFTSEGAMQVHILNSHLQKKRPYTPRSEPGDPLHHTTCKLCRANFATRKELIEHSRKEHRRPVKKFTWRLPDDSYPTQCEHCDRKVNNRREHWSHVLKEHHALRHHYRAVITAICETCGKGFQNKTKLRIHELRHGSPTFRCASCARAFHDKYALARHAATHAPRAPHACAVCARTFTFKGNLTRHQRVHTGATPYSCKMCGKRFKYSDSVRLHVRTVHFKLPHPPRKSANKRANK